MAKKNIVIVAIGSKGDVVPFVQLALEINQHAGAKATIVTHDLYQPLVEARGVAFRGLGIDVGTARWTEEGELAANAGMCSKDKLTKAWFDPLLQDWFNKVHAVVREITATAEPTTMVFNTWAAVSMPTLCEKYQLAFTVAHLMPYFPTGAHGPCLGGDGSSLVATRLKWSLNDRRIYESRYAAHVAHTRGALGLPPLPPNNKAGYAEYVQTQETPVIMGYSAQLRPRAGDWPANVQVVGELGRTRTAKTFDTGVEAPTAPEPGQERTAAALGGNEALHAFLAATDEDPKGGRPVYIGLGSMMGYAFDAPRRRALVEALLNAVVVAGCRAVLQMTGFEEEIPVDAPGGAPGATAYTNSEVFQLRGEEVPHDALFPRCSLVVCHGGAGTVHAALYAQCPVVTLPCLPDETDQAFWGMTLFKRRVSPNAGVHAHSIKTGGRLGRAIQKALGDQELYIAAAVVSRGMKEEGGATAAAVAIVAHAEKEASSSSSISHVAGTPMFLAAAGGGGGAAAKTTAQADAAAMGQ